ncbi:hypothetical protein V5799_012894, partial [Amblyomma americanum]
MLSVIEPHRDTVYNAMRLRVGSSHVSLEHAKDVCRLRECNLGNLVADSYFNYYANKKPRSAGLWSNVNAAVVNGGSLRAPIPRTRMRVEFDMSKPPSERLTRLKILCTKCYVPVYEDVKDDNVYNIATTDFLAKGGDGFDACSNVSEGGEMELLPKCKTHRIHVIVLVLILYGAQHCAASDKNLTLTILHTNDIHSHLEESNKFGGRCFPEDKINGSCYGGVARIVAKVRQIKNEEKNVLFMNGGDFFQGTPYYTLLKQSVISDVMSNMDYDYVCLGNHEFDDGPENLAPFLAKMNESNVTVVGTNTDFSGDNVLKRYNLVKSATKTINGKTIGILGAVIPDTQFTSNPGPNVKFRGEIESFKEEVANLTDRGVNIIIAITHSGFKREIEIVENVTEIDILVGGHTNTFLYTGTDHPKENKPEGPYPYVVNRTDGSKALIVQDFWFGKFLGRLNVTFDAEGNVKTWEGNPILMNSSVPE